MKDIRVGMLVRVRENNKFGIIERIKPYYLGSRNIVVRYVNSDINVHEYEELQVMDYTITWTERNETYIRVHKTFENYIEELHDIYRHAPIGSIIKVYKDGIEDTCWEDDL